MNWIQNHKGALIAFAGAVSVFVHAVVPNVAKVTDPYLVGLGTVVGIIGAIIAAYNQKN